MPSPIPLHIAGHKVDPPVSGVSPWFLSSRTPRAGVGPRIPESIAVATAENHLTAFGRTPISARPRFDFSPTNYQHYARRRRIATFCARMPALVVRSVPRCELSHTQAISPMSIRALRSDRPGCVAVCRESGWQSPLESIAAHCQTTTITIWLARHTHFGRQKTHAVVATLDFLARTLVQAAVAQHILQFRHHE